MSFAELLCLALADERWRLDALCVEHAELNWFLERHEPYRGALAVCACCAVRVECLDDAMAHCVNEGIWGGLTVRQGQRLRRARTNALLMDSTS